MDIPRWDKEDPIQVKFCLTITVEFVFLLVVKHFHLLGWYFNKFLPIITLAFNLISYTMCLFHGICFNISINISILLLLTVLCLLSGFMELTMLELWSRYYSLKIDICFTDLLMRIGIPFCLILGLISVFVKLGFFGTFRVYSRHIIDHFVLFVFLLFRAFRLILCLY